MAALRGYVRASTGEPLVGVPVSDGREVVCTIGPDGGFELGGDRARFVFVTRPTGFACEDWFQRVSADVETPYDFVLERAEQRAPFTFAQVTDLHLCVDEDRTGGARRDPFWSEAGGIEVRRPLTTAADLATLFGEVRTAETPHGHPVAFVAVTGDLTDRGMQTEFAAANGAFGAAGLPVEVIPGNHDHHGHKHEPRPDDEPIDSFGMSTGTTTRYEEHVGPRWWSMGYGGVHFVALDWFGYRLSETDRRLQEAWLAADLALQPEGTPVVLLAHDPMRRDFFENLHAAAPHVRLVASLSGHWHAYRNIRDGGVLHANTGTATLGSFDYAPPQYRLCTWDGEGFSIRTVNRRPSVPQGAAEATAHAPRVTWSVALPGASPLAAPVRAEVPGGEGSRVLILAAWGDGDDPRGGLLALDAADGTEAWRADVSDTVRAGAAYDDVRGAGGPGGAVVFASVAGEVVALEASSGRELWRRQVGDPLHTWVYTQPVMYAGLVFVGDVAAFRALDLLTGETVWERTDLGRLENYMSMAHPVVQAETLLLGFINQQPNTWGLDPRTGQTRWSGGEHPLLAPMAPFLADGDGEQAYAVRFGSPVEKLHAATGERVWKSRLDAIFDTGRPALTGDTTGLLVTSGLGTVHRFDAATGEVVWRTELKDEALLAMGPYRSSGPVAAAGPLVTSRGILQATCGGTVYLLDPGSGEAGVVARFDTPIAAPLASVGEDVIAAGSDGVVHRFRVG